MPRQGGRAGWADIDLDQALLTVATELVVDGGEVVETEPKTDGSAATIALDSVMVQVPRDNRARQDEERCAAGAKWVETEKVFTTETGEWLHPDMLSRVFRQGLRQGRAAAHQPADLRHVAATVQHAAGAGLHANKETLRHSTITLTSNTYTSLLPQVDREIAARAAAVVPRVRKGAA